MLGGLLSLLMLPLVGATLLGWGFISVFVWIFLFERLRRIFPEFIAMLSATIIESIALCWPLILLIKFTHANQVLANFTVLGILALFAAGGVWSIRSGVWKK